MKPETTRPGTVTENTFLGGTVKVLQPVDGYRAGIDPVLLAAATPAKPGEKVMDAGCGVGSVGLCLLRRVPETVLTGIDIQPDLVELAQQNAEMNNMKAEFISGDIRHLGAILAPDSFDHIMINPPFMEAGSHTPSPNQSRALGRGEMETTLADWLDFAFRVLKSGGRLVLLHRADRLDHILQSMAGRFGSIAVFPLTPKQGQNSKRVLIGARKLKFAPLQLRPGLLLHNEDGSYTDAAQRIFIDGQNIDLWETP